jgi:hypothetical protein
VAHELTHVLSSKGTYHKALFWNTMNEKTLPFVKENISSLEERNNLDKLASPLTNEDEEWDRVYLESKKGLIYIFFDKEKIYQSWKLIREETIKGNLGTSASVRTIQNNKKEYHQVNIYFEDVQNKKDIARILERLLELGFSDFKID